jgi:hypothetical protein
MLFFVAAVQADWVPADGYKMHYPQLPDEDGWNVFAGNGQVLADDWQCSETGPVDEIHFWGSWDDGLAGPIESFYVAIFSDVPDPNPQDPADYSMPGQMLWERYFAPGEVVIRHITPDPQTWEGWYDPATGLMQQNDHDNYYQYNLENIPNPFAQVQGTIYWLVVTAFTTGQDPLPLWGWKSSENHWNDAAVFYNQGWQPLSEPQTGAPITNAYNITVGPDGSFWSGGGQDAFGQGWYFYQESEWWNIWFYDHPYDTNRMKRIHIEFDVFPTDMQFPSFLELAVNWSTEAWSIEQPPADSAPPLPGVPEDLYIGRYTLYIGEVVPGHYIYEYEILDFNPEWVSIDVRGYNYTIPMGLITHTCLSRGPIDLSFVINHQTTGACCDPAGNCYVTTRSACEVIDNTYMGDNTQCLGDANGNGQDDLCESNQGLKWSQPPDLAPTGMDVVATQPLTVLADDFLCSETGPVSEIHVWGSWLHDLYPGGPGNVTFFLSLHADIPASQSGTGYSMPGALLWMRPFQPGEFQFRPYAFGLNEGWFDPSQMYYDPNGDTQCWEYIFTLGDEELIQTGSEAQPIVYWLDVQAVVPEQGYYFGWKTSITHWNDDAVYAIGMEPPMTPWMEMRYPPLHPWAGQSIDLAFSLYGGDCCHVRGDINHDGSGPDITDLVYLVTYMFQGGPVPPCLPEADVNASGGGPDIADLVYLVTYMFQGGPPPIPCP